VLPDRLPPQTILLAGAATAALAAAAAAWWLKSRRLTPAERERRRRAAVNQHRRTVEGFLHEAGAQTLYYHYELAGVEYSASQDVSALAALLPADLSRFIGPVSVKYDPRNPANSIVICEDWSGIGARPGPAPQITPKEEPACN